MVEYLKWNNTSMNKLPLNRCGRVKMKLLTKNENPSNLRYKIYCTLHNGPMPTCDERQMSRYSIYGLLCSPGIRFESSFRIEVLPNNIGTLNKILAGKLVILTICMMGKLERIQNLLYKLQQ